MIKEIEQIKMRKDMQYLLDSYGFSVMSLAESLGIASNSLSDFISGTTMRSPNFDKSYVGLEELKRQIKQAEEYQPNDN